MTLSIEKISAVIKFRNYTFATPGRMDSSSGDVLNFTINRNRNTSQPIAQLNCSFDAWMDSSLLGGNVTIANNLGDQIVVRAGTGDNLSSLPTLFTGYVTELKTRPHWSDARKIIVDIKAEDTFVKMRVGPRFTRRFKVTDDAFAIITNGHRRQSGQMYAAKKVAAGSAGISSHGSESTMTEHSPLIKTPDPQGKSPSGDRPGNTAVRNELNAAKAPLRAEPAQLWVFAGMKVFVQIREADSGAVIDVSQCEQMSKCCCFCNPPPKAFSGSRSTTSAVMTVGESAFPISVYLGEGTDSSTMGYEFHVTGSYPARVTFVHPRTGQTCNVEFQVIPPHDHRDIGRGGPAVGSFDVFVA